ncbi:MAG: hypothetical protein V7776_23960, partial [Halopseudomonas aestusnigri]
MFSISRVLEIVGSESHQAINTDAEESHQCKKTEKDWFCRVFAVSGIRMCRWRVTPGRKHSLLRKSSVKKNRRNNKKRGKTMFFRFFAVSGIR